LTLPTDYPVDALNLQTIGAAAKKASPRFLQAVTNHFDFRWCILAHRKRGLIPRWVDHFDFERFDILFDITKQLGLEQQVCRKTVVGTAPGLVKAILPKQPFFSQLGCFEAHRGRRRVISRESQVVEKMNR